jgi:hypothetical protein
MKILKAILVVLLLLSAAACSSENTVKDSDRVVVEYNAQMWAQVGVLAASIGTSAPDAATALYQLSLDGSAASKHLVTIWGPPKVAPPPYSTANLQTAIKQSAAAHASVWLHPMAIAGYAAMALLAGLKIAGSFFPGVGTFVSSAAGNAIEAIAGGIIDLKHQADSAPDDKIHLSDIQQKVTELRETPGVNAILEKAHVAKLVDSAMAATSSPAPAPAAAAPPV